jgi:hypothetical protein
VNLVLRPLNWLTRLCPDAEVWMTSMKSCDCEGRGSWTVGWEGCDEGEMRQDGIAAKRGKRSTERQREN